jgi:glutamyl-tRNA synthetase
MSTKEIRVRFAPSPTGPLHIGGVRTALYNYLFAKKHGGKFILRIEDTDQQRFVKGAEEYIVESLTWCGIKFDEGVHIGGSYGPYKQSERKAIYKKYADELISNGLAYYAFDTPESLETKRKESEAQKATFIYNHSIRNGMRNSLSLSGEEVKKLLDSGSPYVIRFKMPENRELILHDIIRGDIHFNTSTLDDKVLFKSDGLPTYHLANIVDDHLMKISHVIRGEEWLPSLPLHVLLYEAFNWTATMPEFAHLPLLLKPDGKGKLSKRDGDKLGFPVFPCNWNNPDGELYSGFKEWGYFPEAFINMLALLGWNAGTEQELFSMDELISLFSLEKVNKAGARFDPEKAKWFNQQYLRKKSDEELYQLIEPYIKQGNISVSKDKLMSIIQLMKERATFVKDILSESIFFFEKPADYDENIIKKKVKPSALAMLEILNAELLNLEDYSRTSIENYLRLFCEKNQVGMGDMMIPLRIAFVGTTTGPHIDEIMELLGKTEVNERITRFISFMKSFQYEG